MVASEKVLVLRVRWSNWPSRRQKGETQTLTLLRQQGRWELQPPVTQASRRHLLSKDLVSVVVHAIGGINSISKDTGLISQGGVNVTCKY